MPHVLVPNHVACSRMLVSAILGLFASLVAETIAAAQAAGVTMYFTGARHFAH